MARKNKNNSGSNVAVVFYKTENSQKNQNNKSRVKKVRNAATTLKKKGEVVNVDSVLKRLDEVVQLKDGGSDEEDKIMKNSVKNNKVDKITKKVVRKTLKKVKKIKKRSSDDGGVTGNKGRKY